MSTKIGKICLATAIVGVGLVAGISVPASSQTHSCDATDAFQAIALQPGESARISVVNPSSGHGELGGSDNIYGIIVRDEGGKILQETELSPPPGGTAFSTFAFPPGLISDGNEVQPGNPYESFSVEVSINWDGSASSCSPLQTPIAAIQGFDDEGKTSFASVFPDGLDPSNSSGQNDPDNQTSSCAATDTFQAMALQPGESARISVVNWDVDNVAPALYGIRVRNEDGKILQETEEAAPPGGTAYTTFAVPGQADLDQPNVGDGDNPYYESFSVEVSSKKSTGPCTGPIAAIQGFDEEGKTSFFIEMTPPVFDADSGEF